MIIIIERIEHNGKDIAMVLRKELKTEGVNFITTKDMPLQLGILKHKQGARVKPHIHKPIKKIINNIYEVLHIEIGKVECNFYDSKGIKIVSTILKEGDTILLMEEGHGFNILEDSTIFEIKQGPYSGVEDDKTHIEVDE